VKLSKRSLLFVTPTITLHFLLLIKELKQQIDVIHVPYTSNLKLVYPIYLAKKFFNIPYIVFIHGGGMHRWKLKIVHEHFFNKASDVIAVSENIKNEYEKRTHRKIKIIPPLIPFSESRISKIKLKNKYGFKNNNLIILSLGSIKKIKGSDVLLNAFFNLGKEYIKANELKLLFVGEGIMRAELEKKVDKLSFSEYVKFFGNVSYDKVPEIYKLADIYVIPSLFEGTPKSLLEAMFNGLPCIGSDTNGINNVIVNNSNGLLFKVGDNMDLSIKLKKIIENESFRDMLGKSALKFIRENYKYEKTISEFIEIYKNTTKKNKIST
jgi:glycosyltransferase involved in cell wall biosynthesis